MEGSFKLFVVLQFWYLLPLSLPLPLPLWLYFWQYGRPLAQDDENSKVSQPHP